MTYSLHIADVGAATAMGALRRKAPDAAVGLRYADTTWVFPIGNAPLRPPPINPGRVCMFARWASADALEEFLASHPFGSRLRRGWHITMEPLRVHGHWPPLPDLPRKGLPTEDEEPIVVVTIGRTMLSQLPRFLKTSNPAEKAAVDSPATTFTSGILRLPNLIGTISIWRTLQETRQYAVGHTDPAHLNAIREQRRKEFHHESAFIRFRPLAEHGQLDGHLPVAAARSHAPR